VAAAAADAAARLTRGCTGEAPTSTIPTWVFMVGAALAVAKRATSAAETRVEKYILYVDVCVCKRVDGLCLVMREWIKRNEESVHNCW
jgi:hypothetical protein